MKQFSSLGIKKIFLTVAPGDKEYFQENLVKPQDCDIIFISVSREEKTGVALKKVMKNSSLSEHLIICNGDTYF